MLVALAALIARTPAGRRALVQKPPRDRAAEAVQRQIGYGAGIAFFVEAGAFSAMNIVAGWVGGLAVAETHRGVIDRVLHKLEPLIAPLVGPDHAGA